MSNSCLWHSHILVSHARSFTVSLISELLGLWLCCSLMNPLEVTVVTENGFSMCCILEQPSSLFNAEIFILNNKPKFYYSNLMVNLKYKFLIHSRN